MNQTLEAIKNEKIIAIIRGIPTSLILKTMAKFCNLILNKNRPKISNYGNSICLKFLRVDFLYKIIIAPIT